MCVCVCMCVRCRKVLELLQYSIPYSLNVYFKYVHFPFFFLPLFHFTASNSNKIREREEAEAISQFYEYVRRQRGAYESCYTLKKVGGGRRGGWPLRWPAISWTDEIRLCRKCENRRVMGGVPHSALLLLLSHSSCDATRKTAALGNSACQTVDHKNAPPF